MGPILLCIHPSQKYLELPEDTVIVRGLPLRCLCSSLSFGMSAQVHLGQSVGGDDDDEAPKKQTKNGKEFINASTFNITIIIVMVQKIKQKSGGETILLEKWNNNRFSTKSFTLLRLPGEIGAW